jgi:DNA-binding MarR family transcriptional regulator
MVFSAGFQRWVKRVGADGLNYVRVRLLGDLHCSGPQKMGALAEDLGLTARNMTAAVDALESEGLVQRKAHPTDRRATLVELTPVGAEAAEKELAPRLAAIAELFDELSEAEQRQLTRLLDRLAAGLRRRGQCR